MRRCALRGPPSRAWRGRARSSARATRLTVRTDHAARLWLNDNKKPLIDAWVKSGTDTEHAGAIYLIAGRAYPIKLEFSKAKQGVDDSKKNPNKPAPAGTVSSGTTSPPWP